MVQAPCLPAVLIAGVRCDALCCKCYCAHDVLDCCAGHVGGPRSDAAALAQLLSGLQGSGSPREPPQGQGFNAFAGALFPLSTRRSPCAS